MKKKALHLLKTQTVFFIISSIFLAFLVTASILIFQYQNLIKEKYTENINLLAKHKSLELNYFFNSAEAIAKDFQEYILETLDEKRLLEDPAYEEKFMSELTKKMSSKASTQKGIICTFFRMEMDTYGPTRGIFLTGGYQKGFISIRPTDLSKYSPSDSLNVGWYYLPIWNKAPVWTTPYQNQSLGLKMISYCIPVYKDEKLLGITGVDLSLAVIDEMVNSLQVENAKGLLIGSEKNLINQQSQEDLSKAVERSADLSILFEDFQNLKNGKLLKFTWDEKKHYGVITKLDNGMSYIAALSDDEFFRIKIIQIISLAIAFIIVSILTLIHIFFAFKAIINPIKIITKTTNRLARGELNISIPYSSNNEIGTLTNNIHMMTSQLKEYIEYISEQTKKERAAKEAALTESQINAAASQAKSAFLANMSHEIRTPINAVLGMDEMILRESKDKTILTYATNIKIAGSNLLSIVNDVLDFSKIEAGKMELIQDNYEVSSLIIDLVNMSRERAYKKGIDYVLNITPNLPKTLFGDSVRIKQCIINLLTNAIKYTKEGTITFSIDYEKLNDDTILLKIHVKDTGIGIKQEDMEKLFTPFERIDEEKNRTIEGSGLGMSIVLRLLNMMGSKLDVESVYGKGSDFSFAIEQKVSDWTAIGDINEAYEESVKQLTNYKEKLHAPRAHLLFVDDTEMNLEVIKGLLKNTAMTIDTVLSGKEALEAVKKKKYDILFIDHRMPEMDGIQTLHAMKEMKQNLSSGQPCIALTANAISGVKKMYLEEGFDDYLSKPVNPAKLEDMIRHYLPEKYLEDLPDQTEDTNTTENSDNQAFLDTLNTIKELDAETALTNCGSVELLQSTIKQYHSTIDQKALELQQFYDAEDWENYEIKVHALKSTSRLIGAVKLSKLAEKLEHCANNNQIDEIKTDHPGLMEMFNNYKSILAPLIKDDSNSAEDKEKISDEELKIKVNQMIDFANDFDIDGLDNILLELSNVILPLDFSEKFDKIRTSIQNVDFKELRTLLSEWSNK